MKMTRCMLYKKELPKKLWTKATSTAVYMTATAVVNQVIWLRRILADLHMEQKEPTQILVDNQVAISISNNPVFYGRTKHFKIKFFFKGSTERR